MKNLNSDPETLSEYAVAMVKMNINGATEMDDRVIKY